MTHDITVTEMFASAVAGGKDRPFLHYFGAVLSYGDVDCQSAAFAVALQERGFGRGDRFCVQTQSLPQFIIAMIAVWKIGGVFVPVNPMYRTRELGLVLEDAEPRVFMAEPHLLAQAYDAFGDGHRPAWVISADSADNGTLDPRVAPPIAEVPRQPFSDFCTIIEDFRGQAPDNVWIDPDSPAALVYTSGTTGKPKGAINTQRGLALGGILACSAQGLAHHGVVLTLAPLFHVSGVVMTVTMAIHAAASVVLSYRFHPDIIVEAINRLSPSVAAGSITAFIAIMNASNASAEVIAKLTTPMSGGAPVPAAVADDYERRFGVALRTGYGLTETTGAAFMEPLREPRRVDRATGTLSVGRILPTFTARLVDEKGVEVGAGEAGEVVISGPCVSPGYWRKPEETAMSMRPDGFYTGDIGFFDDDRWLYLIDRKKDVIIAGGYKIWPREVEDVIYSHPAIREAAVVGAKDAYRGETVKAIVSLKPGAAVTIEALGTFCRERLAAYKVPREIVIIAELPKNLSGKILRRELRD
ncbi:Long-chain-fatty-acid--CoA ligase [Sphingobium indicum BiD32]|uniref:3-methylmercaptopropionyl-CoA ligase n=1 Tax=Sphingobium indicum BiD32 TaxID=1301087 RepID=N1MJG2_9SPHN|nr:AMP-binding protein [Sphingobium indicum]CCW17091.1 Long-chain-fatty-acid--CoA ligase [Sphingobium indicum BiD32]